MPVLSKNTEEPVNEYSQNTKEALGPGPPASLHVTVIVVAPLTQADAEKRAVSQDFEVLDWYLSKKKLAAAAD